MTEPPAELSPAHALTVLSGVRVVDVSTSIAGAYSAKLLSDAGADVVRAPGAFGQRGRDLPQQPHRDVTVALADHLGAHTTVVDGALSEEQLSTILERADILVESGELPAEKLEEILRSAAPLAVVSLTPFGRGGPWADRPATEFTLQAACGSIGSRGIVGEEPIATGGRFGEWITGTYGAITALALYRSTRQSGTSDHADVSMLEAMALASSGYASLKADLGGVGWPAGPRALEIPSIERAGDGSFVVFTPNSREQFEAFLLMIERPDYLPDEEILSKAGRQGRAAEFREAVEAWTTKREPAEILESAASYRVPAAPVTSPDTVAGQEHFVARGVFVKNPNGGFAEPRVPYRITGATEVRRRRSTTRRVDEVVKAWPTRGATPVSAPKLPLDGVRILDLTAWWAGPSCGQLLSMLGAEVIKLESIQRPDGMRLSNTAVLEPADHWWESGFLFLGANVNKAGVTLNLRTDEGRDLFTRLVTRSDVVIENFTPRVLENLRITPEQIHRSNSRAIVTRMPAFGLDGPWRDRPGFAQTMECLTSMAWVTGPPDQPPVLPRGLCDLNAGLHAAFATMVALEQREATGGGMVVEVPMIESALGLAAEALIAYSADGRVMQRMGNRSPYAAPQGVYRCLGDDSWIAISVVTNAQWRSLLGLAPNEGWLSNTLSTSDRSAAHDRIDDYLGRWLATQDADSVAASLSKAGVPAEVVIRLQDVVDNPHLQERGFVEYFGHPLWGRLRVAGAPFRVRSHPGQWIHSAPPLLGQDNERILGAELELGAAHLQRLRDEGIIGNRPAGW